MDKPEFVPPRRPAEHIASKIKTHDELRLEALETAMAEVFSWTWAAAQSQPAAEPVDVREALAKVFRAVGLAQCDCVADNLDQGYRHDLVAIAEAHLRTPAREVPDSEVPSWRFGNGMLAGKIDGDELANHLRAHNMAIVYREGPK